MLIDTRQITAFRLERRRRLDARIRADAEEEAARLAHTRGLAGASVAFR